ncbi:MAG TPA: lipoyl(octanoyl) transferase LipB [Chloroflexi bacterium]|nr:lipoyl(octanoyl) transferase LipB [Chloroflexota bacterium]
MNDRQIWLVEMGIEPYGPVHALQHNLVAWRRQGVVQDTLLLLEHTPVITLGRRGDPEHILASPEYLQREGIEVHRIERGGDVTYHGPGQIVGYPILRLADYGLGVSDYMHRLEEVIIRTLADWRLDARRREEYIGVWVGTNKIAALGVRIRHGISFHGFALNVAPNMNHWACIVPCGITDGGVTAIAHELPDAPSLPDVRRRLAHHLAGLFGATMGPISLDQLYDRVRRAGGTVPPPGEHVSPTPPL